MYRLLAFIVSISKCIGGAVPGDSDSGASIAALSRAMIVTEYLIKIR